MPPQVEQATGGGRGLHQVLQIFDLFPLSVSSIGPVFSVAATGGLMASVAGWWALPAIAVLAVPFVVASFVFRLLNRHFPSAGASYHWSARVMGRRLSRYQAWVLILAYFFSIPPIAIPAASYTLALAAPSYHAPNYVVVLIALFWIIFASIPLLLGARPTAQLTKAFFALEMASLLFLGGLGLLKLPSTSVPVHFGPFPLGGVLIVAVVAATILDGWEIDSYAAEESAHPKKDPGVSGIIGAFLALAFYAVLYPLMFAETPMRLLSGSGDTDPLAAWATRILGGGHWLILVPILASTAGGLWLTTYIITRALYAMGREHLVPARFGTVNGRHVPQFATLVVLGLVLLVVALQTLVSSLAGFFNLVLSTAGFFLLAEFFLDTLTAIVFLAYGHRRLPDVEVRPHEHRMLLSLAVASATIMGLLLVAFVIYAPRVIGSQIDTVVAILLAAGFGFVALTHRRVRSTYIFHGNDAQAAAEA